MSAASITITYIGRHSIDWAPDGTPTAHPSKAQRTDPGYTEFVARRLEEAKKNEPGLSTANQAELVVFTRAVLDRARDPRSLISGLEADDGDIAGPSSLQKARKESFYNSLLIGHIEVLKRASNPWQMGERFPNEAGETRTTSRDATDIKAQKEVPAWYGHRCALTGTFKPEGAHIVPVRGKHANHNRTWEAISIFWPCDKPSDVTIDGKEHVNIIPLTQTAHSLFDSFFFALRPIAHPETPSTRLFLQVVFLRDPDGQTIDKYWNHRRFGGLADFRRTSCLPGVAGHHQHQHHNDYGTSSNLQHGDVLELTTDDPDAHPLPDKQLLDVQYALHQIMSGMRAAGALRDVFGGTPPPHGGDEEGGNKDEDEKKDKDREADNVPALWQDLIQEAEELGILDENKASRWRLIFARQAHQDAEDAAAAEAEFLRRELDGDDDDDFLYAHRMD